MNVLLWHVHGSWTTSFVQGSHRYLLPTTADRCTDGRGRARTWDWPDAAVEVGPSELADAAVDVVIVQRPRDLELAEQWLGGRRLGRDVALIWLEHNAPQGRIDQMEHPAKDRDDVTVVHVTHTNALFWDTGTTRTRVIEHGVVDPGHHATAELAAAAVVINEPLRRGRVVGADLLGPLAEIANVDLFGMGVRAVPGRVDATHAVTAHEDLPQHRLHEELARRRVYVHPYRWTSLGLSLVEAMHLGMPVVALATTEAPRAVPPCGGVVSNDLRELCAGVRRYLDDPDLALRHGATARAAALERYGLDRFLGDWDDLLEDL